MDIFAFLALIFSLYTGVSEYAKFRYSPTYDVQVTLSTIHQDIHQSYAICKSKVCSVDFGEFYVDILRSRNTKVSVTFRGIENICCVSSSSDIDKEYEGVPDNIEFDIYEFVPKDGKYIKKGKYGRIYIHFGYGDVK